MSSDFIQDKCQFDFAWANTEGLNLYVWQLDLQPSETFATPPELQSGFFGITWKGSIESTNTFSDCAGSKKDRWMGSFSENGVLTNVGTTPAQVAVFGLLSEPIELEQLVFQGGPALDFGEVTASNPKLTAIVYELDIQDPSIVPERWGRPSYFLTSIFGPIARPLIDGPFLNGSEEDAPNTAPAGSLSEEEQTNLRLTPIGRNPWLTFRPGVRGPAGDPTSPLPILVDLYLEGDPDWNMTTPDKGGGEGGCTWRCKG